MSTISMFDCLVVSSVQASHTQTREVSALCMHDTEASMQLQHADSAMHDVI